MAPKKFHLGWFLNFTTDLWNGPFENGESPWSGEFYVDIAQMLERACFDYVMVEDKLSVSEAYGGTSEIYLKQALGMVPPRPESPASACRWESVRCQTGSSCFDRGDVRRRPGARDL